MIMLVINEIDLVASSFAGIIIKAIEEGLDERKREKDDEAEKEAVAVKTAADAPESKEPRAAGEKRPTKKETAEAQAGAEDSTEG